MKYFVRKRSGHELRFIFLLKKYDWAVHNNLFA